MASLLPGDAIDQPETIVNVVSVVGHPLLCGETVGDDRKVFADRVADTKKCQPVFVLQSRLGKVDAVRPVRPDDEVVQQVRRDDVVEAEAPEMGLKILLPGGVVDRIWKVLRRAGDTVVIARAVGAPKLELGSNAGVDAHGERGVLDGGRAGVGEVVKYVSIGGRREVSQYVLRDRREAPGNYVAREGGAALNAVYNPGRRGIEDLSFVDRCPVTRVGTRGGCRTGIENCRVGKIAGEFLRGGHGGDGGGTEVVSQLLPGKEEEGLVAAVVNLRYPDRAAERAAIVVLAVHRGGEGGEATWRIVGSGALLIAIAAIEP